MAKKATGNTESVRPEPETQYPELTTDTCPLAFRLLPHGTWVQEKKAGPRSKQDSYSTSLMDKE